MAGYGSTPVLIVAVIREIEEEDRLWQAKAKKRKGSEISSEQAEPTSDPTPISTNENVEKAIRTNAASTLDASSNAATQPKTAYRGFY